MQSPTTLPTDEEDWSDQDKTPTQKRTPEDFYKIVSVRDKYVKRFQAYMYDYNVQFLNVDNVGFEEATPLLGSSIFDHLGNGVELDDRVRLVFESPSFNFPISLRFMRMDELTV